MNNNGQIVSDTFLGVTSNEIACEAVLVQSRSPGGNILARYGTKNLGVGTSMPWEITVKIPGL